jgi:hypothetical protein
MATIAHVNMSTVLYEGCSYHEMMSKKVLALIAVVVAVGAAYAYKK